MGIEPMSPVTTEGPTGAFCQLKLNAPMVGRAGIEPASFGPSSVTDYIATMLSTQ